MGGGGHGRATRGRASADLRGDNCGEANAEEGKELHFGGGENGGNIDER